MALFREKLWFADDVTKLEQRMITRDARRQRIIFLISNFRRVPNVECFHLGNSPASEFYMQTFRNAVFVPSS